MWPSGYSRETRSLSTCLIIYLVFFFWGDPIPLWPRGLAYRAVRLWTEQMRRFSGLNFSQTVSECKSEWAQTDREPMRARWRKTRSTWQIPPHARANILVFFSWWLTHVWNHEHMTKPVSLFITWPEKLSQTLVWWHRLKKTSEHTIHGAELKEMPTGWESSDLVRERNYFNDGYFICVWTHKTFSKGVLIHPVNNELSKVAIMTQNSNGIIGLWQHWV